MVEKFPMKKISDDRIAKSKVIAIMNHKGGCGKSALCDALGIKESLDKLNNMLNERYMGYDHVTQMNILEFIRERRDVVEIMAIVSDMNEREQELKEILLCLVDDLDKRDGGIVTKIKSIDKGIKDINKRFDKV